MDQEGPGLYCLWHTEGVGTGMWCGTLNCCTIGPLVVIVKVISDCVICGVSCFFNICASKGEGYRAGSEDLDPSLADRSVGFEERRAQQIKTRAYPTTSIGSFPQTTSTFSNNFGISPVLPLWLKWYLSVASLILCDNLPLVEFDIGSVHSALLVRRETSPGNLQDLTKKFFCTKPAIAL